MRDDGLTVVEGVVMDGLISAFQAYCSLPVQHPDEPAEFASAVHRAQDLLAVRVARRDHPDGWVTCES